MAEEKLIGELRTPSGSLLIADTATLEAMEMEDDVDEDEDDAGQSVILDGLPTDKPISVYVTRGEHGPWIESLRLEVPGKLPTGKIGTLIPLHHEILLMDMDAFDDFMLLESRDGKYDVVLWGGDEVAVAQELGAVAVGERFGWKDLTEAQAEEQITKLEGCQQRGLKVVFAADPHSDYAAVKATLVADAGATVATVGKATVGLAMLPLASVESESAVMVAAAQAGSSLRIEF